MTQHFSTLRLLLNGQKYDDAQAYIGEFLETIEHINQTIHTNNPVMDAVVSAKLREISEKGIDCQYFVNVQDTVGVDNMDLCTILGNALDNAIRSCEQLEGERKINLEIKIKNHNLIIVVKNSFDKENIRIKNGRLETTKSDSLHHGYGMISMERSIRKYRGILEYKVEEYFELVIVLQNVV